MKRKAKDWCVYIVQYGKKGPVKVGMTCDLERRVCEGQTFCPAKIYVLAKFPCKTKKEAWEMEKRFHYKLRGVKIRGEWFDKRALQFFQNSPDPAMETMAINQELDRRHLSEIRQRFGAC